MVFNVRTPAGFALTLVYELYKSGRISLADKQVIQRVIHPIADREAKELHSNSNQRITEVID